MSAIPQLVPQLQVVPPTRSLPPRANSPASIEFMLADLARSGLVPEDLDAYPVNATFTNQGAYCIPYFDADGHHTGMYRIRYDRLENKYIGPKGLTGIWLPKEVQTDKPSAIYLVEGEKKSAAYKKRFPERFVMGMGGCTGFATKDGFLAPELLSVLQPGTKVLAIFDADIQTNIRVRNEAARLAELIAYQRAELQICYPPQGKGVDDWLLEDPDNKTQPILVELSELASFSKKLGQALGCRYVDDKLVLNELNAKIILDAFLKGTLIKDHRLGLLFNGAAVQPEELENKCLEFMQKYVHCGWRPAVISKGLAMLTNDTTDHIQALIRGLKWDGVPRLDSWGSKHFASDLPKLANEWGRILMTGFGLRLLQPGTKVDTVCILGGAQGIGKSTFFEDLSSFDGRSYYTACTAMSTSEGDAKRTQGISWAASTIVDLAEGVIFRDGKKSNQDLVKQEISQVEDQFRLPYAKSMVTAKRGFVFVGTTNRMDLFGDFTGSRRYFVLQTFKIEFLAYETKLQILAEVAAREEELRSSKWYDMRLEMSDLPTALREANPTVTDVRELLNTEFGKNDTFSEDLLALLEGKEVPSVAGEPEHTYFITTHFLSQRLTGRLDHSSRTLYGALINGLMQSPTFPFTLTKKRVTTSKLQVNGRRIPEQQLQQYVMSSTNQQSQGWWAHPKAGWKPSGE